MQRLQRHIHFLCIAIICVFTAVAFFSFSPYRVPVPHRDSGIFVNIGNDILHGKLLYHQTWDNKQPLIYFINALGLWLGQGSTWGVWGVELVFLLATMLIGYRLLRITLPAMGSLFVVLGSFLTIFPLIAGNYSEEYSLLFQMGILAVLFFVYLPNRRRNSRLWASLGIGVLAGLSFCIKQTYIDVAVSVGLFLLFLAWLEQDRRILPTIALMAFGFLLVNALFWLYFLANGALSDYVTSAFVYNRFVASLGLLELIHSLLERLEFLTATPLFLIAGSIWLATVLIVLLHAEAFFQAVRIHRLTRWIALAAGVLSWGLFFVAQARGGAAGVGLLEWLAIGIGSVCLLAALFLFLTRNTQQQAALDWKNDLRRLDWSLPGAPALLFLGLINLPLTVLIISISGRDFSHYYIPLFSALFLLLGGALAYLVPTAAKAPRLAVLNSLLAALLILSAFGPILQISAFLSNPGRNEPRSDVANYLNSVTTPGETILVWGWESIIYYLADRPSPTRYAFQYPAYESWPDQQDVLTTILSDLQNQPPAYIADLVDGSMPLIEGRSADTCLSGSRAEDPQMLAILSFVCSNYDFDRQIDSINIYKLRKTN